MYSRHKDAYKYKGLGAVISANPRRFLSHDEQSLGQQGCGLTTCICWAFPATSLMLKTISEEGSITTTFVIILTTLLLDSAFLTSQTHISDPGYGWELVC